MNIGKLQIIIIQNIFHFYKKLSLDTIDYNSKVKSNLEITSIAELKQNSINGKYIRIIKIQKYDFNNIILLKDIYLYNLEILDLEGNNIENIEPLSSCKCKFLKLLSLKLNKVADNMIDVIGKLNFPILEELNLSYNYFTKFEIFKNIEHFQKLKNLDICSNLFTQDINHLKNVIFNLESVAEINLSNGIFSNETIKMLSNFNFKNLQTLNLTSNNLNSLSFLDKINCPELEKLIVVNNDISDLDYLSNNINKLKNLKIIDLKNNCITDIEIAKHLKNEHLMEIKIFGNTTK